MFTTNDVRFVFGLIFILLLNFTIFYEVSLPVMYVLDVVVACSFHIVFDKDW